RVRLADEVLQVAALFVNFACKSRSISVEDRRYTIKVYCREKVADRERTSCRASCKARVPTPDDRDAPVADNAVRPSRRVPADIALVAKRQVVEPIGTDNVCGIKVGIAAAYAEIAQIADKTCEDHVYNA